jgi:predicted dehydrogenase
MLIGQTVVDVPRYESHPGRVIVETDLLAVVSRPSGMSVRQMADLARDRFSVAATTLRLDGPAVVLDKARHMLKRETASAHRQYAAFAGRRSDTDERVAGFSLTHPRASEQVLTRPEQIWAWPDGVTAEAAALTLFGGVVLSALDAAGTSTVGVLGDTALSELAVLLAQARGLDVVARLPRFTHVRAASMAVPPSGPSAPVWLAPTLPEAPDPGVYDLVIATVGTAEEVRAAFPGARRTLACSAEDIVVTDDRHVDLFFDDGPAQYPAWFAPERCAEYLEHAAALQLSVAVPVGTIGGSAEAPPAAPGTGVRLLRLAPGGTGGLRRTAAAPSAVTTVGLVGAGRWPLGMVARQMELSGRVRLKTVYDRRPEACYFAQNALPFERATTDIDDVLGDPDLDLVIVAPYHGAHADVATEVLRAGKHCFLEKPAAVTFDQYWALAAAAAESDKVLHIGNNRRFAPFVDALRAELGRTSGPTTVQSYMRAITIPPNSWYYWPSQGSRVISNVCHIMDLAIALTSNADPVEIETRGAIGDTVSENVTISVVFADGSLASLVYTNRGKSLGEYYEKHTVARGDRTAEIEHFRRLRLLGDRITKRGGAQDFGHRRQIELFLDAVRGERPPPVDRRTLLISAYAALAADQSLRTGQPVKLPIDDIERALGLPTAAAP